jgi:hypothetical protein
MTSQIAVFNPLGVAVASDTVTTISTDQGTKTTNNAQKIFPLVEPHLLVVIESGSVISNGVHMQLLINEWSRTLEKQLPTVKEYAHSFAEWYSTESDLIPKDSELREVHLQLNDHYYEVKHRVEADAMNANSEEDVVESFKLRAQQGLEWLEKLDLFDGATDDGDAALLNDLNVNVLEKIDFIFKDIPGLDEVREILVKSAPLVLSRSQSSSQDSDLGFIGFGEKDFFATSVRLRCRARYGKTARVTIADAFGASVFNQSGSIACFAQDNAIFGFLRGAQFDIMESAYGYLWAELTDDVDETDEAKLKSADELLSGLRKHIEKIQSERFIDPMLETIGSLSLIDVAALARSLVGMQAIRSAASPEPASVGGFIESLVIDRANGIRWIHRLPQIIKE